MTILPLAAPSVASQTAIVFVHGGFVDGSGWEGICTVLKRNGFDVSVVQNATESLAGDVAATHAAIDALNGAATAPAWKTKPSWYLVARDDRMIPPDAQRAMAMRAGATAVELDGSHAIYVSQPGGVAELIEAAAEAVTASTI